MKTALFSIFIASVLAIVPTQSDSESADYVIRGGGYVVIRDGVQDVVIDLALKNNGGKLLFQNGNILIGTETSPIDELSLSLLRNGKALEINAMANDMTIKMNGKLVTSNDDGSIYQLNGYADEKDGSHKLILHVVIAPESTIHGSSDDKQNILLLVDHYDRVEWKSQYKFIVKTYDPKSNPMSSFHLNSGFLEGVQIRAMITDPLGNTIKVSDGMTKKFGYYEDTLIIPDNARTGLYTLNVTASGEKFNTTTKELTFLVIPLLPPPTATP